TALSCAFAQISWACLSERRIVLGISAVSSLDLAHAYPCALSSELHAGPPQRCLNIGQESCLTEHAHGHSSDPAGQRHVRVGHKERTGRTEPLPDGANGSVRQRDVLWGQPLMAMPP